MHGNDEVSEAEAFTVLVGQGVGGVAAAGNWFEAHWGAAAIAAAFLVQGLPPGPLASSILRQAMGMQAAHLGRATSPSGAPVAAADLRACIRSTAGALTHVGHNVIYFAHLLRVQAECPTLLHAGQMPGLTRLLAEFVPVAEPLDREPPPTPEEHAAVQDAPSLARWILGTFCACSLPSWPAGHLLTHGTAVLEMRTLGAPDEAALASWPLIVHARERRRDGRPDHVSLSLPLAPDPWTPAFWERDLAAQQWGRLGHYFKYAYAFRVLAEAASDAALVERARGQFRRLMSLRYDPPRPA